MKLIKRITAIASAGIAALVTTAACASSQPKAPEAARETVNKATVTNTEQHNTTEYVDTITIENNDTNTNADTNNETNALHWEEFRKYTEANAMSRYERKLLRDWVRSGHSVYETVQSRYLPGPSYPPMDFLEMHRFDRELAEDMVGMTRAEKDAYLKACIGWSEPKPEEISMGEIRDHTPEQIQDRIRRLERDLFNLWQFVAEEGLLDEAQGYVEGRRDEAIPFEW